MKYYILLASCLVLMNQELIAQSEEINLDIFNTAIAYQSQGDYETAINNFSLFISSNPDYTRAYYYRGYSYLQQRDYRNALGDFLITCELDTKNEKAFYYAGKTYYMLGEYEKAKEHFSKAIQINPKYAAAYNDRGMTFYQEGNYDMAIESFYEAVRIDTSFAMAYNNAGSARFYNQDIANPTKGDLKSAREWFDKATKHDQSLFIAWYNKACMSYFLKEYETALTEIERAAYLQPENPMVYFYKGLIQGKQGDFGVAFTNLEKSIELAPNLSYAYEEIGNLHRMQKNYDEAITAYKKAQNLSRKEIYEGLMWYFIAEMYSLQEDEAAMHSALKTAKSKGVFKDKKVYQSFLKSKAFRKYRVSDKLQRFTKSVRKGKKVNRFTDTELAWFRMGSL